MTPSSGAKAGADRLVSPNLDRIYGCLGTNRAILLPRGAAIAPAPLSEQSSRKDSLE
jgi:hypothetical protein